LVHTQTLSIVMIACALAAGASGNSPSREDAPHPLLLVDDHHILYRPGTERILHPAKRYRGNPVLGESKPWEEAIAWTSVHYNPETNRYQLWYQAYGGKNAPLPQCVTCYAESQDGIHWAHPPAT